MPKSYPSTLRYRPIYGGPFGRDGRYSLATLPVIERGLHAVRHLIIEPRGGLVLAMSLDKREALASARRLLRATQAFVRRMDGAPEFGVQAALWADADLPPAVKAEPEPRPVSRRRHEIFERSTGKCHYCGTVLTLDGKWHIEHMMPRALGGTDKPVNLVAACVACNLEKRDRSALEFVTSRHGGTSD